MNFSYFIFVVVFWSAIFFVGSEKAENDKLELARKNFRWSKTDLSRISQKIHELKEIEKEETDELLKHDPKLLEKDPNKFFNETMSEEDDESFKILNSTHVDSLNETFSGSSNETEYKHDPDYSAENDTSGEIHDTEDGFFNITSNSTIFGLENANFTTPEVDNTTLILNQTDPILKIAPDSSNSSDFFLEKDNKIVLNNTFETRDRNETLPQVELPKTTTKSRSILRKIPAVSATKVIPKVVPKIVPKLPKVVPKVVPKVAPKAVPKVPKVPKVVPKTPPPKPHGNVPQLGRLNKKVHEFLFEGDVAYSEAYIDQLIKIKKAGRRRRQAMVPNPKLSSSIMAGRLWPKKPNKIPYFFAPGLTQQIQQKIIQALNYWEARTCVGFVHNQNGKGPKMRFFHGDGCYSLIGQWEAVQGISIGEGCEYIGIIAHEIGHALGFYHAQARWDRDSYVQIMYGNLPPSSQTDFIKTPKSQNNNYNQYYDYGSVMHYGRYEFSINRQPSLITKNSHYQWTIGQRILPSFLDVKMMNQLYGCRCANPTVNCLYGGYPNPNNCGWWSVHGVLPERIVAKGSTMIATANWQNFEKTASVSAERWLHQACHWHINSPKGSRIQVKILAVRGSDICIDTCFYTAFEVNLGDKWNNYGNTGVRYCCQDQIGAGRTFTTHHNKAVVSTYISYKSIYFKIQYRLIWPGGHAQPKAQPKKAAKKAKAQHKVAQKKHNAAKKNWGKKNVSKKHQAKGKGKHQVWKAQQKKNLKKQKNHAKGRWKAKAKAKVNAKGKAKGKAQAKAKAQPQAKAQPKAKAKAKAQPKAKDKAKTKAKAKGKSG